MLLNRFCSRFQLQFASHWIFFSFASQLYFLKKFKNLLICYVGSETVCTAPRSATDYKTAKLTSAAGDMGLSVCVCGVGGGGLLLQLSDQDGDKRERGCLVGRGGWR